MLNQIENKIDEYLVWPYELSESNNDDIRCIQDLSTAEIGVCNIAFDERSRKKLFLYGPDEEFAVSLNERKYAVNLDSYIRGYANQMSKQQTPEKNAPIFSYSPQINYDNSYLSNRRSPMPELLTSLPGNIIRSSKYDLFFPCCS